MNLKTLQQADLNNKKVLLRVDLNLPISDGKVTDLTRLNEIEPTVKYLLKQNAKIALCSHFGRPDGQNDPKYSLNQIVETIEETLNLKVIFVEDCIDSKIPEVLDHLLDNQIVLLENTRFYSGEEKNNPTFAEKLAAPFDLFINDAFGAAHRAHASTVGVTDYLDSYAGLLIQKEVEAMSPLHNTSKIERPLTVIVGGAKIDTKIGVLKNFIGKADYILIGGALANTFLLAEGFNTGNSLVEKDKVETAQEILLLAEKEGTKIMVPGDSILASEISPTAQTVDLPIEDITDDMMILDVGRLTAREYSAIVHKSKTVILNGPMGLYELEPFSQGTKHLFEEISKCSATTILGGGDTIDAVNKFNLDTNSFTHISTGGGAMIEFLEGKTLPGIEVLISS